jgi:hypothetical protein
MRSICLLALIACSPDTSTGIDDTDVEAPIDFDRDGHLSDVDCDDRDFETYPGADEVCDKVDNDCDGTIDEDAVNADRYYTDQDRDGFGAMGEGTASCDQPPDTADRGGDCDDQAKDINPDATEVCDDADVDESCNGFADDDDPDVDPDSMTRFYADEDGDGFGDPERPIQACDAADHRVLDNTDCNDKDAEENPDLGCGGDWNGGWTGELILRMDIPELRISDSCTVALSIAVQRGSKGEIWTSRAGTCALSSLKSKYEVHFNARFTGEDDMAGNYTVGSAAIPVKGSFFAPPDTLEASGKDSVLFEKYKVTVAHSLKAHRDK